MDSQFQSSSWNSGENFNFNPNAQIPGGDYFEFQCSICNDYGHQDYQCNRANQQPFQQSFPSSGFEPNFSGNNWNIQGYNQWENRDTSFQGLQHEPSSHQRSFQVNDNAPPSSDNILEQQVVNLRTDLGRIMELINTMADLSGASTEHYDQKFDQQAERISVMEQAQSKSDEIIKAQSEKIKSLEETVHTLETRLKNQLHEQTHQHAANLRRIKQLHLEVPPLREDLLSTKTGLRQIRDEQWAINCVVKRMAKTEKESGNGGYTSFQNPELASSSCRLEPSKDMGYNSDSSEEDFQAACIQLWGNIRSPSDGEKQQQMKENAQEQMDIKSSPTLKESIQDVQIERLGNIAVIDSITPPKRTSETDNSCSDCGSNCAHQLRACVNMIQVQPSLKKVEEAEIRKMRSKQKKKLQRKWVPRGIFDIRELCRIDSILSELKCLQQVWPRVRKRQRKPPEFHDSHD